MTKNLKEKFMKLSKLPHTSFINESDLFSNDWQVPTDIPIMNLAASAKLKSAGVMPGITIIAGPSKHFKSNICLQAVRAFQKKHPDGIVLYYDCELGAKPTYFTQAGINVDNVLHIFITNIEELQFDLVKKLNAIERGDPVMVFVDSLGNLASKKEAEDMENENAKKDMSRAGSYKSLFRVITPKLILKDIPFWAVGHVYQTMEFISKTVVSGGTGMYLSADNVLLIGREQAKTGTELDGYNFKINIDKSRFVKEKSKFELQVRWDGGIMKYSGLFALAVEGGFITRPTLQKYEYNGKEYAKKDIEHNPDVMEELLDNEDFINYVERRYELPTGVSYDNKESDTNEGE